MKYKLLMYIGIFYFSVLNLTSCGDMFARKSKIFNNYYLVETEDSKIISICYKTKDGDFIGRVPNVLEYGILGDTILIAKTQNNNRNEYYIVFIKKDSDYAEKKEFLIGPLNEDKFNEWKNIRNVKFIKV